VLDRDSDTHPLTELRRTPRRSRHAYAILIAVLASFIAARIVVAQLAAPPDRIWNLRGTGAGAFTVVVDVSGRNELAPYFVSRDPKDLRQICTASRETEAIARRATEARLAALANTAPASEDAFWTRARRRSGIRVLRTARGGRRATRSGLHLVSTATRRVRFGATSPDTGRDHRSCPPPEG
jgi:hypothetical protein